jgi:hypothetical protein
MGLCDCGCGEWVYPPASIVEVPGGPNWVYLPECKKRLERKKRFASHGSIAFDTSSSAVEIAVG